MNNTREKLESISKFFEIGKVEKVSRLGGIANKNFSVRTTKGGFVFKIVKEHSADNLKTIDPLFRTLKSHRFPAAYYLSNSSIEFVFDHGNTVAVVMHNERGIIPDVSSKTVFVLGKTLARLHSVPVEGLMVRSTWFHPNFLSQGLIDLASKVDAVTIDRYHEAIKKIDNFEESKLRKSIIHGDYHPGNVLFYENGLSAVLDWEEASFSYSLIDLAYAVFIIFFVDSKFNPELYSCFMDGYQSERPLLSSEKKCLSNFVRFVGLTVATWISLRYGVKSSNPKIEALATRYWTADLENWEPPNFDI